MFNCKLSYCRRNNGVKNVKKSSYRQFLKYFEEMAIQNQEQIFIFITIFLNFISYMLIFPYCIWYRNDHPVINYNLAKIDAASETFWDLRAAYCVIEAFRRVNVNINKLLQFW